MTKDTRPVSSANGTWVRMILHDPVLTSFYRETRSNPLRLHSIRTSASFRGPRASRGCLLREFAENRLRARMKTSDRVVNNGEISPLVSLQDFLRSASRGVISVQSDTALFCEAI